jgi:hypothetical protein
MWTRGKDKERPERFAFELWDGFTLLFREGGFATAQEADRAGERANRNFLLYGVTEPAPQSLADISADDLLAELLA